MADKIYRYVKNKKNVPIATLVATLTNDGVITYGYSICSRKDSFRYKTSDTRLGGRSIADRRATFFAQQEPRKIAHSIIPEMISFIGRAEKYFKNKPSIAWTQKLIANPKDFAKK